jgi:diguanylate cyclase (GGDEF)-like protein
LGTTRRLRLALAVALAMYCTTLLLDPTVMPDCLRLWLPGNLAVAIAIVILVTRARTHPAERSWVVLLALGVGAFVAGGNLFFLLTGPSGSNDPPVLSQVCYLLVSPFLLAGVLLALRQRLRHARMIVALDGLTGAMAGAAVSVCAIAPLVERLWNGSSSDVVSLAFVFSDVLMIITSLGALAIVGLAQGRNFAVWALGMMVFAVGDIVYAYLLAADSYLAGTWVDGFWAIGLGLIAVGATMQNEPPARNVPPARSLAVVTLACVSAVVVLSINDLSANPVPSVLALVTLGLSGVRFALGFLQLRELAVVREQAMTDELTGLANRRALYARLDELLGTDPAGDAAEEPPGPFSLVVVDLDRFKEVNDSLGHATGDELLQAVVTRFALALENLDTPHLLTRLGGDEFAVVLGETTSPAQAMAVGEALQAGLAAPIQLGRAVLHVRASIGVALSPQHGITRSDILFAADAAMYASKTSGAPVRLYAPDGVGDRRTRLAVAEELYTALEKHELTVAYQPICASDGRLLAAEALVRWDHPTRGRLYPDDFIGTAERYRLTQLIAERVLDVSLSDLARWRTRDPHLTTSVNISASDLRDESIVDIVAKALLTHRVPPEALTVEITETDMMRDPAMAQRVMHALADLGVQLSVDDYGTGYSSLEYLLELPVNEIKLDRAFSTNLERGLRSVEIVRSTVLLTHALGLRMVAEGVEDEATLATLRHLGCDRVQGWHLGRPMTATAFSRLVGQLPARVV